MNDTGERGVFISFEGADGTGKSTQVERLTRHLREQRIPHVFVREPGSTDLGEQLRRLLLHADLNVVRESEALLYAAARVQLLRERILPALKRGLTVICDRYVDSSFAYQSFGLGLPLEFVRAINIVALREAMPDLTVLFYLPPGKRHGTVDTKDRIERRGLKFQKRVRQGYLDLARREPERFVTIDATQSVAEIQKQVKECVLSRLQLS